MITLSIMNNKGGVGKTISAINIAHVLVDEFKQRVLLIDNDQQGNTSKFFGLHSEDSLGMPDILVEKNLNPDEVIKKTAYENLDLIISNMNLAEAEQIVARDGMRVQQTRLKDFLETVKDRYDYCIIDNAPSTGMAVINALAVTDDVLVPIKIDRFSFDGLSQLLRRIEETRENFNPKINFKGCFVTMEQKNNITRDGNEWLNENYKMFSTSIRHTVKVSESTFLGQPLLVYASKSDVADDYRRLVSEYLGV